VASEGEIKQRFSQLEAWLDERARRLWAAAESAAHGRGGISLVARASGVSRRAIVVGLAELQKKPDRSQRTRMPIRQKGGGRKKASLKDPDLLVDLEKLLEPVTRGDPQSPLRWTCKSVRHLADELRAQGHEVSHMLVAELLHEQKYSLQANRKTKEGSSHPDRNAQFEYINAKATEFLKKGQPAISVDTKKKEQVGDYKNGAANGGQRAGPNRSGYMTLENKKTCPMESTISDGTRVGSALAPITTRQRSRSRASGDGGI
jgi:transposase